MTECHACVVCVSSVRLWHVQDGLSIQSVSHVGCVTCVAFSLDSQFVVTGSEDLSLKVWEAATGKLTQVGLYSSPQLLPRV